MQVVEEFKQQHAPDRGAAKYLESDNDDSIERSATIYKNVAKEETESLEQFDKLMYIINKNEIECDTLPQTCISQAEWVGAKIAKSEKISPPGIFSQSYVLYEISTSCTNSTVKRRFKHFEWLDSCLQNRFPVCYVPFLPPKVVQLRIDDELTEMRKISLQQYLDQVCSSPMLKYSPELELFLCSREEEFSKIVQESKPRRSIPLCSQFTASSSPMKVQDVKHPDGKLNLMMNVEMRAATRDIIDSIQVLTPIDEQAILICGEINDTQEKLARLYHNLSLVCEKLQKSYLGLEKIVKFPNILKLADLYDGIREYLHQHSKMIEADHKNFHDHIRPIFEFSLRETQGICRISDERAQYSAAYNDKKTSLRKKKAKLYKAKDVSKWGLEPNVAGKIKPTDDFSKVEMHMLSSETKQLRLLRHMWAYINAQVIKETDLFMKLKFNRSSNLIKNYTRTFLYTARNLAQTFEALAPKLLSYNEEVISSDVYPTSRKTRSGTLFGAQLAVFI